MEDPFDAPPSAGAPANRQHAFKFEVAPPVSRVLTPMFPLAVRRSMSNWPPGSSAGRAPVGLRRRPAIPGPAARGLLARRGQVVGGLLLFAGPETRNRRLVDVSP
jgi:hypothetical protein